MARWLIVFGLIGLWRSGDAVNYENHTLLKIYPSDENQFESVKKYSDPDVDVLKRSRDLNDSMDLLIPHEKLPSVEKYAKANNLLLEVKDQNYGRNFESPDRTPRRRNNADCLFQYISFDEINRAIEKLAKQHPNIMSVQPVGLSYQGRRMQLVRISTNRNAHNPAIFIDAGIHAREWVAPAMALYLINRLVTDPRAKDAVDGVDWLILPVVNPDGYEFSRSSPSNRMWRKTMSKNDVNNCFGVDGNRNYGFKWAVSGVSNNPCDKETYAGNKPFSEPETRIVKNIMFDNKDRIKLYVSLHAYGQYLVYPWGYTGDRLPKEWKKLDRLARVVSSAVERAGGPPFRVLSAGKWYPAAGGSDDFAFGGVGIPYSYTMELTEGHEFVYPERLLEDTLPKLYPGFVAFASEIRREFSRRH